MAKEKYNRRSFLKITAGVLFAGFLGLWDKVINTELSASKNKKVSIPFDGTKKVIFTNDFIIVNKQGNLSVYSSHCTHLGCVIKNIDNDKLVCPCHGSEFSLSGEPLKGPAIKPLEKYDFELDRKHGKIIVKV